jgi:hypothetical protein
MVTLRNQDKVAIAGDELLVQSSIRRVNLLDGEPLGAADSVIIDLFQIYLVRRIVHVMFVGRIT